MNHESPKPRLGQHFLKDTKAVRAIVKALDPVRNETIIEIGPGTGILTKALTDTCEEKQCLVTAIEKDDSLVQSLEAHLPTNTAFISGDALKILPKLVQSRGFAPHGYALVGNIPYYITGKLLRVISELQKKPRCVILMVQREVAERISAKPGNMNLLAAAIQYWAKPEIIMRLEPTDFSPPPEIHSAIIALEPHKKQPDKENKAYYVFIRHFFKQPRKTILNNLR